MLCGPYAKRFILARGCIKRLHVTGFNASGLHTTYTNIAGAYNTDLIANQILHWYIHIYAYTYIYIYICVLRSNMLYDNML